MDDGQADLLVRHKLDVADYYRMAEVGILDERSRVELIDGEIIDMAPIGQDHQSVVIRLTETLSATFFGRAFVSVQNGLRIDRLNEPQPDFVVLPRRDDYYARGERPNPRDALLVIEIARSSLRYDRAVKIPLYARAGVPEYWIVDLLARAVEVHRRPDADRYAEISIHHPGETITLAAAPDVTIEVSRVLG